MEMAVSEMMMSYIHNTPKSFVKIFLLTSK